MAKVFMFNVNGPLCDTCKYIDKCVRYKTATTVLSELESAMLEKWRVDIETDFSILQCDLYFPDTEGWLRESEEET